MLRNILEFTGRYVVYQSYVEENHLLGGVYAKISTDDRGIYFFTEGRKARGKIIHTEVIGGSF